MGKAVRLSALTRDLKLSFPTKAVRKDVSTLSRGQRRRAEKKLRNIEKAEYTNCVLKTADILNGVDEDDNLNSRERKVQKHLRSKKSTGAQKSTKGHAGVTLRDFRKFKESLSKRERKKFGLANVIQEDGSLVLGGPNRGTSSLFGSGLPPSPASSASGPPTSGSITNGPGKKSENAGGAESDSDSEEEREARARRKQQAKKEGKRKQKQIQAEKSRVFHKTLLGHQEYRQNPLACLKSVLTAKYLKPKPS